MIFVCYSLLNSQNILTNNHVNNSEKGLVTRTPPAQLSKLQKLHRKVRSKNWPMVSFIHNGSETTTWMEYSFKQNQKDKTQSNIFKIKTYFLNLKLQIIRLAQGHCNCTPTHSNRYFQSNTFEKVYYIISLLFFSILHFTKRMILSICWQKSGLLFTIA